MKKNERVTLHLEISNLLPSQAERILGFLGCWYYLGAVGASRKTEFYCDGDGSDRFIVRVGKRGLLGTRYETIKTSDPDALDRFVPTYNTRSLRAHLAKKATSREA